MKKITGDKPTLFVLDDLHGISYDSFKKIRDELDKNPIKIDLTNIVCYGTRITRTPQTDE